MGLKEQVMNKMIKECVEPLKNLLANIEDKVAFIEEFRLKMVTVLSETSTDGEIPTAKSVFDYVNQKIKLKIITKLDENSTDEEYASAKAVFDFVNSFEHIQMLTEDVIINTLESGIYFANDIKVTLNDEDGGILYAEPGQVNAFIFHHNIGDGKCYGQYHLFIPFSDATYDSELMFYDSNNGMQSKLATRDYVENKGKLLEDTVFNSSIPTGVYFADKDVTVTLPFENDFGAEYNKTIIHYVIDENNYFGIVALAHTDEETEEVTSLVGRYDNTSGIVVLIDEKSFYEKFDKIYGAELRPELDALKEYVDSVQFIEVEASEQMISLEGSGVTTIQSNLQLVAGQEYELRYTFEDGSSCVRTRKAKTLSDYDERLEDSGKIVVLHDYQKPDEDDFHSRMWVFTNCDSYTMDDNYNETITESSGYITCVLENAQSVEVYQTTTVKKIDTTALNVTRSINDTSTDDQVVTAKALYNFVKNAIQEALYVDEEATV